jgi:hypothetical protein
MWWIQSNWNCVYLQKWDCFNHILTSKNKCNFEFWRHDINLIYLRVFHTSVHLIHLELKESRIISNCINKVSLGGKKTFSTIIFVQTILYTCFCTMKGRNFKFKYFKQFKILYYLLLILTVNLYPLSFSGY